VRGTLTDGHAVVRDFHNLVSDTFAEVQKSQTPLALPAYLFENLHFAGSCYFSISTDGPGKSGHCMRAFQRLPIYSSEI
jgi:hypothetical protein